MVYLALLKDRLTVLRNKQRFDDDHFVGKKAEMNDSKVCISILNVKRPSESHNHKTQPYQDSGRRKRRDRHK